jgi:hypothetical protein
MFINSGCLAAAIFPDSCGGYNMHELLILFCPGLFTGNEKNCAP